MVRYIYFSTKFSILEPTTGLFYAHSASNQSTSNLLNDGLSVNCVFGQISSRLVLLKLANCEIVNLSGDCASRIMYSEHSLREGTAV